MVTVDISIGQLLQTGVVAPAIAVLWFKAKHVEGVVKDIKIDLRALTHHLIRGDDGA